MAWWEVFRHPSILAKRIQRRQGGFELLSDDVAELEGENIKYDKEAGASGTEIFQGGIVQSDEYNPDLQGERLFEVAKIMKNSDGAIRAALLILKLPFLRTEAKIVPENPDDTDAQNLLIAETCNAKLIKGSRIHETWDEQLRNRLLMFDYGFSVEEKIHTIDDEGFLTFSRMAARMPWTVEAFKADPGTGQLREVRQRAWKRGKQVELKIQAPRYAAVYSWDKEGDNYWGKSVLRFMYKHWWYKEELYRIDAVRLDRWGIGIPDAEVAEGKTLKPKEKADVIKMLQQLRGNERAYILRPAEVKISILTPQGQGGALGLMDSVNHHDVMIFRSILAGFMTTGNQEHGNYGSTRSYADMYLFALQAAAKFLEEQYTRQVIRQFCIDNFDMTNRPFPRLKFTDIQKIDLQLLSESLSRLTAGKIITPDDDLEAFFRVTFGWPKLPEEFTRKAMRDKMESGLVDQFGMPIQQVEQDPNNPGKKTEGKSNPGRPPKPGGNPNRGVDQGRGPDGGENA